jgi:hypothetical protein
MFTFDFILPPLSIYNWLFQSLEIVLFQKSTVTLFPEIDCTDSDFRDWEGPHMKNFLNSEILWLILIILKENGGNKLSGKTKKVSH